MCVRIWKVVIAIDCLLKTLMSVTFTCADVCKDLDGSRLYGVLSYDIQYHILAYARKALQGGHLDRLLS